MAITLVTGQTATGSSSSLGATVTATLPVNATIGNVVVSCIASATTPTPSTTTVATWILASVTNDANNGVWIYYGTVTSATKTVAFTHSGVGELEGVSIGEFAGIGSLDGAGHNTQNSNAAVTTYTLAGGEVTTYGADLVVSMAFDDDLATGDSGSIDVATDPNFVRLGVPVVAAIGGFATAYAIFTVPTENTAPRFTATDPNPSVGHIKYMASAAWRPTAVAGVASSIGRVHRVN